jgi:transposase-like protein
MEIITGVERRRRWRADQKLRILAELDEPSATVAEVARRHEVSRGLLWQWRDAQRRGELVDQPAFLPMRVLSAPEAPPGLPGGDAAVETDRRIEIVLPNGTMLRVSETVGAASLHRVLTALRR